MIYSPNFIQKNSIRALTLLAVFSNSCGKSNHKDKEPSLPTETLAIHGGVGVSNGLIIAGPGAELKQGEGDSILRLEGDADLTEIRVQDAQHLKVESNSCADAVCTIRYTQTELAPETQPISLTLRIRNAAGADWKEIQASVLSEAPSIAKLPAFTPQYKQKVELGVPVAPGVKVNITNVTGGSIDKELCADGLCKIAMTYDHFQVKPTVSFTVSDNIRESKAYILQPEAEVLTLLKTTANVFEGSTNLTFVPGVDYKSSWNRPVHAITLKNPKGVSSGPVACDVNLCTTSVNLLSVFSTALSFDYALQSFGNESAPTTLTLKKINPEFRGRLTEAPIEFGQDSVITLRPGQEYDASEGTLPTSIAVQNAWGSDITISKNTCDAQGVCSFHVTYKGKSESYSLNYVFERGSYRSPAFPLRLTPWLSVAEGDHKIWKKNSQEWQELVLQSDKNYKSADGQLATSVLVTEVQGLNFKDVTDFKTTPESLFTCDSNGTCRALVQNTTDSSWQTKITYRLRSANHVSPLVTRSVVISRDYPEMIENAKDAAYRSATLTDATNFLHEFSTTFVYGIDYKSQFPASHMTLASDDGNSVSFDDAVMVGNELTVPCDAAGACRLSGNFSNKRFFTRVKVAFRNDYSADNYGSHLYLIESSRAGIFPDQSSYRTIEVKQGVATIIFEKGPGLGYVGQLAKTVRLRETSKIRFSNATEGQDANGKFFEVPCDEAGRCVVQGKLTELYPVISYSFMGADGQASVELAVTLSQPDNFAEGLKQTVAIQSGVVDLNFRSLLGPYDYTIDFFNNEGTVLGSATCDFHDCLGTLKLPTPFNRVNETLVLNYHRKVDGKVISDVGTFTLTGGKTYRMKGLEKTAKKDDERTHSFTISKSDIEALGDSPLLMPLGSSMKLKFNVNGIVVSQRKCEAEVCTFTLVNVPASITQVKVEVSQPAGRYDTFSFQTSSFDLIVNP